MQHHHANNSSRLTGAAGSSVGGYKNLHNVLCRLDQGARPEEISNKLLGFHHLNDSFNDLIFGE